MDTIYSKRTGATPLASSQPIPSNPMVNAPATRFNAQAIQDYLRANQAKLPQGDVQYPQGIDLQTLVNNAQQDNQAITRPDYDINPPTQPQQGGINIDQLLGQIASGGSLSGIDAGAPQPTNAGPEAFANEQTMADNGLLPTSAPKEISQNPTNDTKQYSQGAVNKGLQSVDIGMSSQNPNSAMSAETQNLDASRIKGDMVNVAQARDPKAAWQDLKKDPFYKDSNFYTGMMNVGLAIMSGANPMQAFQAGSQAMASADMKSQLRDNRDYLLQQYTPDSVAAAISSGDPKMLKQREMSDADKAAMQNNEWTRRNSITSAQDDARADRNTQISQAAEDRRFNQQDKLQQQRFDQQKELFNLKQDAKTQADNSDIYGGVDPKVVRPIQNQFQQIKSQNSNRMIQFHNADAALIDLQDAQDTLNNPNASASDKAAARSKRDSAYRLAQEGLARGVLGTTAMLDDERISHLADSKNAVTRVANNASIAAGLGPTQAGVSYLKSMINQAQANEKKTLDETMENSVQRLVEQGMDETKARKLITSTVGLGLNTGSAPSTPRKSGALSTDDSWMYNN